MIARVEVLAGPLAAAARVRARRADGLGADPGGRRGPRVAALRLPRRAARDRLQPGVPARGRREHPRRHRRAEADHAAAARPADRRHRRLLVPDHADPPGVLTATRCASSTSVPRTSAATTGSTASSAARCSRSWDATAPARRACSRPCTSPRWRGRRAPRTTPRRAHRRRGHARRAERVAARRRRPTWAVGFQPGTPKRATVDGAPCATIDALAEHAAMLVFTPERLAVMKGAPALRRRYLDRAVARSWPRYAARRRRLRRRAAAAQPAAAPAARRRAGPRRAAAVGGAARPARIGDPPRARPPRGGAARAVRPSISRRSASSTSRSSCATRRAGPTTRPGSWPSSRRAAPATSSAAARRPGPHHDELAFAQGERDLRSYGSQGEQRSAVLALLTAEADLVREVRGVRPVLLLDDVASELDRGRAQSLLGLLRAARAGARHRDGHPSARRRLRSRDPRRRRRGASGMMPG